MGEKKQRTFKEVIIYKLGRNYGIADELLLPMLAKRLLKTDTVESNNSALIAEQNCLQSVGKIPGMVLDRHEFLLPGAEPWGRGTVSLQKYTAP